MRLTPKRSKTSADLPLGFEAAEDFARGTYSLGDSGGSVSAAELDKKLKALGPGEHTIVIPMAYRLKTDPPKKLRRTLIRKKVVGPLNRDELARIIYEAARAVHENPDMLRDG